MQRLRDRARISLPPERRAAFAAREIEQAGENAATAIVVANVVDGRLDDTLDGTQAFTGLNVGGDDKAGFLGKVAADALADPTGLAADVVETDAVLAGSITPPFVALTSSAVLWTAESTQKEVQTLAVTVVRGSVLIDGLINSLFTGIGSSATVGTLKLFRDAVEITPAAVQLGPGGDFGGAYALPRQFVLRYVDTPGAGSFTYSLEFAPGEVTDGQVLRRSLIANPLEG